jgi:aminopeptidase N
MKFLALLLISFGGFTAAYAQSSAKTYTHADTLRGKITAERAWWDVMRYDLTLKPDYTSKTIAGKNIITYKAVTANAKNKLQLDLRAPLTVDSVMLADGKKLDFSQEGNVWHVQMPEQKKSTVHQLSVYYHGKVHEAIRAPWDGGFTFQKDSLGRPWMTVTCQGEMGASVWYPCKDHQSDEPDKGASLSMIVPDSLVAIANGRLEFKKANNDGTTTYKWGVVNPISNYCLIPYIGKYVSFNETYAGEKGKLDLSYWVLDYNLAKAKNYIPNEVHEMLKAFEYWMGPYPFYEDSYKLIDVPHTGMEHQSAVAYGNHYATGYRGRDGSGTGWGMKWDFIIVHESGHEWFGNNITTKDLADMWVHEGFTNYSETLYTDYRFGKAAGDAYNAGTRKGIKNDRPIIPVYDVNAQGSGDMYPKGGNMLHAIRHGLDNDEQFRQIIRGLGKTFYHQTVTTQQVENYISKQAGFDYSKVFDQYLRTTKIPQFEYKFNKGKDEVSYRYTNCVNGFNLPLSLKEGSVKVRIVPTEKWSVRKVRPAEAVLFDTAKITSQYYVTVVESK